MLRHESTAVRILFAPFVVLVLAAPFSSAPALANLLDRPRDPVVMTGAQLPGLVGARPDLIVGFRREGSWVRIPVQVDERANVDFTTIYHVTFYDFLIPSGYKVLTYTDPSTWTGPDPNPAFDDDDELVFMAREAGDQRARGSQPAGTVPGSGVEVTVTNPLNGRVGYVYLFRSDGSLGRGPWPDPVTNSFYLLPNGAPYKGKYNTRQGPNPENTLITSANYSLHFSDRWRCDAMRITAPGASGVDILDDRKIRYNPTTCVRSERGFSFGEGAIMVSREGSVRALRGYCGANSGPTTYRVHKFYDGREDVVTTLRLHPTTDGLMDFFDYAPAATGMIYRNNLNPQGVVIDGSKDLVRAGQIQWEMVTGPQGTLVMTHVFRTDIPGFKYTSYYQDASLAPNAQCSGDSSEYGASGVRLTDPTPNTDPLLDYIFRSHRNFEYTRVIAYDSPGKGPALAQARVQEALQPPTATATPYVPSTQTASAGDPGSAEFQLAIGPQPLYGQANVDLTLPAEGELSLQVLDVTGRSVATLARGRMAAGRHEFAVLTAGLRPGIYFARARLEGHGERVVRFLLLL